MAARSVKRKGPAPSAQRRIRDAIVDTARRMNALGINRGTAGNVSARTKSGFLITPSAMPYEAMKPADIVAVGLDGSVRGSGEPSTEWHFHRAIYAARPEVGAIVHTHSVFATTLACLDRGIPAFHYMVAKAGGNDIRCAPYATFGTQQLADHAMRALDGRRACLLSHHGMIAVGDDLDAALGLAVDVEWLAETYVFSMQAGKPVNLPDREMRRVLVKFGEYGKRRQHSRR